MKMKQMTYVKNLIKNIVKVKTMQREKMIVMADKLIQMGEEIKRDLENKVCTIYFKIQAKSEIDLVKFSSWKTDEEIVEYFENSCGGVAKWWR